MTIIDHSIPLEGLTMIVHNSITVTVLLYSKMMAPKNSSFYGVLSHNSISSKFLSSGPCFFPRIINILMLILLFLHNSVSPINVTRSYDGTFHHARRYDRKGLYIMIPLIQNKLVTFYLTLLNFVQGKE